MKEKKVFKEALLRASEKEIRVMTISDYKTSGVGGSFERNNAFYTLVRTRGTSAKENVHAGGSLVW